MYPQGDTSGATPRLVVAFQDYTGLLEALKPALKGKKPGTAWYSYQKGILMVQVQGCRSSCAAEGYWPGSAGVTVDWVRAQIKAGSSLERPFVLKYEDNRLFVNSFSVSARWDTDRKQPPMMLSLNPPFREVLMLRYLYDDAQINAAGCSLQLRDAENEAKKKIAKAAKILEDMGVSEGMIAKWLDGLLSEDAAKRKMRS